MLVQEMLQDPLLSSYSVIIIDDCHDRSVNTDLALGLLKKIRRKRPQLKIIISSATQDVQLYMRYFQSDEASSTSAVSAFYVEGRSYPVEILYLKTPTRDYIRQAIECCYQIHRQE